MSQINELGGGSFSSVIAPCTLDQVMDIVGKLGEMQRHPFFQVCVVAVVLQ
jgi:hypothetical protein